MITIKRPLNCVDDRTVRWSLIFLWRENYMDDVAKWILYEDDMLLVLRKPAGIAVESAKVTEKDLISMLRIYTGNHVFMVHRLDQVVEGVIVFTKTRQAAAVLSGQLNNGVMKKRYTARICGKVRDEAGVLTDCLVRDKRQNMSMKNWKSNWSPEDIIRSAPSFRMRGCPSPATGSTARFRNREGRRGGRSTCAPQN